MKIKTPTATLEGDNIEEILEKYGRDSLRWANLRSTNLSGVDLHGIDLSNADLTEANLRGANLYDAHLISANMYSANLRGAELSHAHLNAANLRYANLRGANLYNACLIDADMSQTDVTGAYLTHAELHNTKGSELIMAQTRILPDTGAFTGWKKAYTIDGLPVIVKLRIPQDAQRSNSSGRKCRASKARVMALQDIEGHNLPQGAKAYSTHDPTFVYKVGETVEARHFNTNRWVECTTGIHFFITRTEAVNY